MGRVGFLIVDDEPLARAGLRALVEEDPECELLGECATGVEAVRAIRRLRPDVVLLDVQMPDLDGFGVLRALDRAEWPVVVFVTAYDAYALRAFEVHAVDYLLKPFGDGRAREALAHARERVRGAELQALSARMVSLLGGQPAPAPAREYLRRIAWRDRGRVAFVAVEEVDWIGAEDDYVRIHARSASPLVRGRIGELARQLDPERFVRIHRSTLVNIDRVRELRPAFHGDYTAVLHDGTELRVSRTFGAELAARTGNLF